jgi:hypothetical protein
MKKLLLILTLCLPAYAGSIPDGGLKLGSTNSPLGFIDITVFSNIDKQFFQYNLKQQYLSLIEEAKSGYAYDPSGSRITIPVKEFKCTNRTAYRDFLTLLKADQYPNLEIYLPHNSNFIHYKEDSVVLKRVSIVVAGVSKQYDLDCKIDKASIESQFLNGTIRIKLTDLGIVPPVKLLGIVKVKNEIIIDFEFCLKSAV